MKIGMISGENTPWNSQSNKASSPFVICFSLSNRKSRRILTTSDSFSETHCSWLMFVFRIYLVSKYAFLLVYLRRFSGKNISEPAIFCKRFSNLIKYPLNPTTNFWFLWGSSAFNRFNCSCLPSGLIRCFSLTLSETGGMYDLYCSFSASKKFRMC